MKLSAGSRAGFGAIIGVVALGVSAYGTDAVPLERAGLCLRGRGHGEEYEPVPRAKGAGVFAPQLLWLDKSLLEDVIEDEEDLKQLDFDLDQSRSFMFGGLGYADRGYGVRIGGGIWGGYRVFDSEKFKRTVIDTGSIPPDTTEEDVVTKLRVIPACAGFLIEKAVDVHPVTLFGGGLLGGGVLVIIKNVQEAGGIFTHVEDDSLYEDGDEVRAAVAPMLVSEIHGGVEVALGPVFAVGLEGVYHMNYAPDGFVTGTGSRDFFTAMPAIRLRLTFGRVNQAG